MSHHESCWILIYFGVKMSKLKVKRYKKQVPVWGFYTLASAGVFRLLLCL